MKKAKGYLTTTFHCDFTFQVIIYFEVTIYFSKVHLDIYIKDTIHRNGCYLVGQREKLCIYFILFFHLRLRSTDNKAIQE